jgi:hypothetical protein
MKRFSRALKKVLSFSPIKFNRRLFRSKRGRPPNSGFKPYKHVWLAKGDFTLISVWAKERKTSIQSMEHLIVMQFLLCVDNHHEDEIKRLTADRALLYATLGEYIKRFGKLNPIDGKQA